MEKNLCFEHLKLDDITAEFLYNVPTVGEESITDWLIWNWRVISNNFKSTKLITIPFNKKEEVSNGADLELWILTRTKAIPLIFQAKKAVLDYDSYLQKLNYKAKGAKQKQYDLLENYAKSRNLNPYYLIYTIYNNSSIFMIDITDVKKLAKSKKGTRISKKQLLNEADEFYKLFCFKEPLIEKLISSKNTVPINKLPNNIKELLNSERNDEIVFEKASIYEKLESNPENESCFLRCQNKIDLKKINTIKYYKNDNYFVKNLAILDLRDNII